MSDKILYLTYQEVMNFYKNNREKWRRIVSSSLQRLATYTVIHLLASAPYFFIKLLIALTIHTPANIPYIISLPHPPLKS